MKNIIDIRSRDKYNIKHIPGAINIEYYELLSNPNKYLKKDEIYHLYCSSGYTSKRAVYELNKLGFNTINIDGGINNYLFRK